MAIVSDDSTSAPIAADNDREDTAEFFQENDRSVTAGVAMATSLSVRFSNQTRKAGFSGRFF